MEIVKISKKIKAPVSKVFDWFYKSENFIKSPIVFKSTWLTPIKWTENARRDIIMIAGRYFEEITEVKKEDYIRYRVYQSFPSVQQEFTEIAFEKVDKYTTNVVWTIEIEVPTPFCKTGINHLAGKMAGTLYKTILTAGKKELER